MAKNPTFAELYQKKTLFLVGSWHVGTVSYIRF